MSKTQKPRKPTPRQEASAAETSAERLAELAEDPKLARLVAANPNAPAELLLELSHSDDKTVRKACTSNANTPMEALLKLGAQFPEQLLENPVFDLLLLAHPGLFEELPTSTLNSLLKRDQVPVELIRWAWKHRGESTLHSLLMNPNTPADVVEELCKSKNPEVRMAAELHCVREELPVWAQGIKPEQCCLFKQGVEGHSVENGSPRWYGLFTKILLHGDPALRERCIAVMPATARVKVARDNLTASEVLRLLAKDQTDDVRQAVAGNSQTPSSLLAKLALDQSLEVRREVANNKKTPPNALAMMIRENIFETDLLSRLASDPETPSEVLVLLSHNQNKQIRLYLAQWEHAPPEALSRLALDESVAIRRTVACNSSAPEDALIQLSSDPYRDVRDAVARHGNTPARALDQLSRDNDSKIRKTVARNQNAPANILSFLAADQDWLVRAEVAGNSMSPIEGLMQLATDPEISVRIEVARNRMTPTGALALLVNDQNLRVRGAVAQNSNAPIDVLMRLSHDSSISVRRHTANNSQANAKILELLAKDSDNGVAMAVAANSNTSVEDLNVLTSVIQQQPERVRGNIAYESSAPVVLTLLAKDQDSSVRERVAGNNRTPGEVLSLLAKDQDAGVRQQVAGNNQTPEEVLSLLAKDQDADVREQVVGNSQTPAKVLSLFATDQDVRPAMEDPNTSMPAEADLNEASLEQICIEGCQGSTPSPGRRLLFTLPQCPADILAKNFRSRSWLERFAIAGNPSTPESVLERIANEGNQLVRRAARANLEARSTGQVGTDDQGVDQP